MTVATAVALTPCTPPRGLTWTTLKPNSVRRGTHRSVHRRTFTSSLDPTNFGFHYHREKRLCTREINTVVACRNLGKHSFSPVEHIGRSRKCTEESQVDQGVLLSTPGVGVVPTRHSSSSFLIPHRTARRLITACRMTRAPPERYDRTLSYRPGDRGSRFPASRVAKHSKSIARR